MVVARKTARSEKTQQSKRRREEKRLAEFQTRAEQRRNGTRKQQKQQAQIDKRRIARNASRKLGPAYRAHQQQKGLQQFNGNNPEHNRRHGMTIPDTGGIYHLVSGEPMIVYPEVEHAKAVAAEEAAKAAFGKPSKGKKKSPRGAKS